MYITFIDQGTIRNLKDTFIRKEYLASYDVSKDFIANIRINREYVNSMTVDQNKN